MANSERGNFLSKVIKGRFGRAPRADEQPKMSEAVPPVKLSDQGKSLAAMLSAYDTQQEGMTPEEKRAQNERVARGEEDVTVSDAEFQRRRAGVQIMQDSGKSMPEAMRDVRTLEEASETIPGIKGLLRLLAETKAEEKK